MHEPTFRACVADAGLNPFLMEMTNIREQDTWVHAHDPEGALLKAKEMVAAAVAKVRHAAPLRRGVRLLAVREHDGALNGQTGRVQHHQFAAAQRQPPRGFDAGQGDDTDVPF